MANFSESQRPSLRRGFTLIELMVVAAILALLLVFVLIVFKPQLQLQKARDSQRKADLQKLATVLGDYYNDKNCYPASLACDPGTQLQPYIQKIPCDPFIKQAYGYTADCSAFRIYAKLENPNDPIIRTVGCQNGCGPGGAYNYGVSSPNVGLEGAAATTPTPTAIPTASFWYACQSEKYCNQFTSPPDCEFVFNDPNCGGGCDASKICQ